MCSNDFPVQKVARDRTLKLLIQVLLTVPFISQGGDCGEGIQIRSLSCMVHNGSVSEMAAPVDEALCGEMPFQDNILKQTCSVPCPGM